MTVADKPLAPLSSDLAAQWQEAGAVYPIYFALSKLFDMGRPFSTESRSLPSRPTTEMVDQVLRWLDDMDSRIQTHQLRKLLQTTTLNSSEEGLRALVLRHLQKRKKTSFDRDKIDFLLVQYFALEAPPKIYHKQIELRDVAAVLKPVLGEVFPEPLEWCRPLETMIEALRGFRSLRQLLATNFIVEGRKVKEFAGGMFYDPASLLAFVRFNFLLRRAFIELMHADLIAVRAFLCQLEAANVHVVNCSHAGLSEAESISRLVQVCNEWKQPFQGEYTENSTGHTFFEFSKLLALRAAVENAVQQSRANPESLQKRPQLSIPSPPIRSAPGVASAPPASAGVANHRRAPAHTQAAQPSPAPTATAERNPVLDLESCMEKIWEQLIASPPARGRSMTTVAIANTRILMSAWEVAAFVTDGGQTSDDLRRAVSARALVAAAIEIFESTGDRHAIQGAIETARNEVSFLQGRVEAAKRIKDTAAAVNLGMSTKRLLSVIEELEGT